MIAPDEFAEVIERIDNLRGALEIPMPVEFHINQMKVIIPLPCKRTVPFPYV